MGLLSFITLLGIAYLLWRVTDQLPDLIFRLSEIQRDIAEIRRRMADDDAPATTAAPASPAPTSASPDSGPGPGSDAGTD